MLWIETETTIHALELDYHGLAYHDSLYPSSSWVPTYSHPTQKHIYSALTANFLIGKCVCLFFCF